MRWHAKEIMNTVKSAFSMGSALLCKLLAGLVAVKISAHYLGVENFGLSGQISSLIAIVTLLAGGGVTTGLTKIYADTGIDTISRDQWRKAAQVLAGSAALFLIVIFVALHSEIVNRILDSSVHANLILLSVIVSVLPISLSAIAQGVINGNQQSGLYAKALLCGSLVGIAGFLLLSSLFGVRGALCGLVWMQIAQALAFCWMARHFRTGTKFGQLKVPALGMKVRFLFSFGLLSISAGITIPLVYILVRSLVIAHQGAYELGIWQATVRLSEAYTQLPMLMLSVVFFPRFAAHPDQPLKATQVRDAYGFVFFLMLCIGVFVGLTRETLVRLLFTSEFHAVSDFVFWQIAGDTFRMLSYVGTTILAARGFIKLCMLAEFIQALLFGGISALFVTNDLAAAPFVSYLLTYLIYFLLTVAAVMYFGRRKTSTNALTDR